MAPLMHYAKSRDADLLLVNWWLQMERDGDLAVAFTEGSQSVTTFLQIVAGPGKALVYATDAQGIWFAAWFEPMLRGVFMGVWIRRTRRGTKAALETLLQTFDLALTHHVAVIVVTKQERLARELTRLGYNSLGKIDGLWDGLPAWTLVLQRAGFEWACQRLRRVPMGEGAVA